MFFQIISLALFLFGSAVEPDRLNADPLKNMKESDTLYINFSITNSEFGQTNEGLILVKKDGATQGKYVRYRENTYGFRKRGPGAEERFFTFYKENRSNYDVWVEWTLTDDHIGLISEFLARLLNFKPDGGVSNAPESYVVLGRDFEFFVEDMLKGMREYRSRLLYDLGVSH